MVKEEEEGGEEGGEGAGGRMRLGDHYQGMHE